MTNIVIIYYIHTTSHPFTSEKERKVRTYPAMPTSDSWAKSCSSCDALGQGRRPRAL